MKGARVLLVVGGGLFGSQAAAWARRQGHEALVFDAGMAGAASPAAAGLFKEEWAGKKGRHHFEQALPVLDSLYGIRTVMLMHDDGRPHAYLWVPPSRILEPVPVRATVSAVGDGWLTAGGRRYEGWVYIAAGVWSKRFLPGLEIVGKAGTSFLFPSEHEGRISSLGYGRQALAFVRDSGSTYFSDGTAETDYTPEYEQRSLENAARLGLGPDPMASLHGVRPYTRGGPLFAQVAQRTWLATGGRKMGTIVGAAFARRLVERELG